MLCRAWIFTELVAAAMSDFMVFGLLWQFSRVLAAGLAQWS